MQNHASKPALDNIQLRNRIIANSKSMAMVDSEFLNRWRNAECIIKEIIIWSLPINNHGHGRPQFMKWVEKLIVERSGMVNKKNINMNILEVEYISGKWEVLVNLSLE
jgi:hypothetical protein